MEGKFIAYYRVSTARQGESGLGLEAQQEAVRRCLNGGKWKLIGEFEEVESGRKEAKQRPQLVAALAECKRKRATLVIGKLDRLARNVRFFLTVLDDYGVPIRFAEFADIDPKSDEGRMLLINMANFAEFEGRRIGSRTRAALAVAKAKGKKLGVTGPANLKRHLEERMEQAKAFSEKLRPILDSFKIAGFTQVQQVEKLNELGITTPRGRQWTRMQLHRVLQRLEQVEVKHTKNREKSP